MSNDDLYEIALQRNQMVTMIDSAGRMLEVRSEMRRRFVYWVAANEVCAFCSSVYFFFLFLNGSKSKYRKNPG